MKRKSSLFFIKKYKGENEMSLRAPLLRSQLIVFPELLAERVESEPHAARFFLYLVQTLDLQLYKRFYLGTPPYNRTTLVAVILYAMYKGHFENRGIVQFAVDSIGAQWILNGMKMPSYKTVGRTINGIIDEIDQIFKQILILCGEQGLIGGKRCYTDGVKVQANASKHKAMSYEYLGKKIIRGKEDLKELFKAIREVIDDCEELTEDEFQEIIDEDAVSAHEGLRNIHQKSLNARQERVFNRDYNETEAQEQDRLENEQNAVEKIKDGLDIMDRISPEKQDEALELLNNIAFIDKRVTRMEDAKTELENKWAAENGNKKIPGEKQINFTDSDSCIMQTKHHGVQQCYNNFALVDDKANIIMGTYTSNNSSDQLGLVPCIENTEKTYGSLSGYQLGADAGFFSANNIAFAIGAGIDFYASYPEAKWTYAKDKFKYCTDTDTYTCPEGNTLTSENLSKDGNIRQYTNEDACKSCIHSADCTKAKDGVRKIIRDMENDKLRDDAREKANSAEGREILRLRKSIPEPVWGNIKTQDDYIQMHYRGIEKAEREFRLHCVIQNIRKLLKVYFRSKSYQKIVHDKCGGCYNVA
jgi:transposase